MPLFPPVALRAWPCNYKPQYPGKPCPDCALGFWAQGAAWLHFLKTKRAPTTVAAYRSSLRGIANELTALGYNAETTLRADQIVYALAEMASHVGASRYNVARMALKGYLEWRNDPNARRPLNVRRVFKDAEKRATADDLHDFDPNEVWRRIEKIDTRPLHDGFPLALRDAAFIALLFGTGMRPGAAALLTPGGLDFKRRIVAVPVFKATPAAKIPVLPVVLPLARRWMQDKRAKAHPRYKPTKLLFHGPAGGQVRRNDWKELVARYGLRAGWKSGYGKPFTLRNLRPTFGSWMLNAKGGDLGKVQRQLQHKSPETTARYYARYQTSELQAVVSKMKL